SMAAMERVHKTVERLESRIEADPKDLVSIDSLAQMFYIAGSYDKASEYLKMHLDVEPDNRDVKMFLATTYGTLNRTDEAIALIKEILKEEPTYAFGLYNLGLIYAHQGNKDEALKNWKLLVQHYPGTDIAKSAQQQIHNLEHVDQPPQNQDR
ncbi:MAG: tetratricopeptide repeat protein, partial [bacterium]